MVACDSDPNKVILLDQNGRWLSTVKSVEMKFDIGQPITVTCMMYEGVIKPSKPQIKSWQLVQLKTVPVAEFNQMLDTLQSDAEAIKSMLSK